MFVDGCRNGEDPIDERSTAMTQFAEAANGLHRAEALLDELPPPLTDRVARVPGRPDVDRTPAAGRVLATCGVACVARSPATVGSSLLSHGKRDAASQFLVTWVRSKRIERRVRAEHQEKVVLHLKRLLQPVQCSVRIAEACIDDGEGAGRRLPSSR